MTRTHRTRPDRRTAGPPPSGVQGDGRELAARLHGLDGSGYGAYKGLTGRWSFDGVELAVRKVQADPFAPPSRLRITVPAATAELPVELYRTPVRARALGGFLLRALRAALRDTPLTVDAGGQEVLERSAIRIDRESGDQAVELGMPLPGHGRRIAGHAAARTLTDDLPAAVHSALTWTNADRDRAVEFV